MSGSLSPDDYTDEHLPPEPGVEKVIVPESEAFAEAEDGATPAADLDGLIPEEATVQEAESDDPAAARTSGHDDLRQAIVGLGADLGGKLEALQRTLDRELRAESAREKVVDRLHAELQEYKQDLLLRLLRPIFLELIQLHDDLGKVLIDPVGIPAASQGTDQEVTSVVSTLPGPCLALLRGFQQGIEDLLYRQGVEPFQVDEQSFDPRQQRAVSTVPTDDPEQIRTIARRLRPGFRYGDRVLRPELVVVHATPSSRS